MIPRLNNAPVDSVSIYRRINIWFGVLALIMSLIIARLFYLQIVKHDYYRNQALNTQQKELSIPSERGNIYAYAGDQAVPLVLNQTLYTLFADPGYVKDISGDALKVAGVIGGNTADYENLMRTKNTRYVVLAKRLTQDQKDKIINLKMPGIGAQSQDYRIYPQNNLGSQLLGFVDNDGNGKYGIEEYMNKDLAGTPGLLKAVTDVSGIPLAASRDNTRRDPVDGKNITLTIDMGMQQTLEKLLKSGLDRAKSSSGSALIMDPNSGAIKAMANWPTYNPAEYYNVTDSNLFNNPVVSTPLEVGSTMKVLTAAAALDSGVIQPDTTYYDPAHWDLDGHKITNIEEDGGAGTRSIAQVLDLSINTGATWMLMQMGGGQINQQARDRWYGYMTDHYQLGKATGIEQGYEASGYIPDPKRGDALSLTYANTSFGQAMTATPLQMGAAISAVVNGGTYYQPHLVEKIGSKQNESKVVAKNVVSEKVSTEVQGLMEYVVKNHYLTGFNYLKFPDSYIVGGKTGTAQVARPASEGGGYYDDKYNGTYVGFVGGNKPQYVIVVRVNDPRIGGYAGSGAAQPIFSDIAHSLIDNFGVVPKT